MSESIIVAIITGCISLFGTVLTILATNRKQMTDFKVAQAITEQKIVELTREVRAHNSFATRVPILEEKVSQIERKIS